MLPLPFPKAAPHPFNDFLRDEEPYKESFKLACKTSYEGFVIDDNPLQLDKTEGSGNSDDETTIQVALNKLLDNNYFRTDVTQPFGLGTKCAKTYVTRCLLGERGTTYKYLGLRMFAHPWENTKIKTLKENLSLRTKHHLNELNQSRQKRNASHLTKGRSDFDVCLINRMEISDHLKRLEGEESMGNKDNTIQTSVSWHADSSLEHFSTIAVYQTIVPSSSSTANNATTTATFNNNHNHNNIDNNNWYVALRVAHNSEGPNAGKRATDIDSSIVKETPPIAANLPSGSAYYLLDDFNHHHQHTVLAVTQKSNNKDEDTNDEKRKKKQKINHENDQYSSSSDATSAALLPQDAGIRYSCTYRLLRESHNVNHVIARCKTVCSNFHRKGPKIWRSEQLLLSELESEWIRQFYVQGTQHHDLLWSSWGEPMEQLLRYWSQLEGRTKQVIDFLRAAAEERCSRGNNSHQATSAATTSRVERKAKERRRKALTSMEELLQRTNTNTSEVTLNIYGPIADLLEERAEMRKLWSKREGDHVFRELPNDQRPMELPIIFCSTLDSKDEGACVKGISPLDGSLESLTTLATSLRAFGRAYMTQNLKDLPADMMSAIEAKGGPKEDNHSKTCHWPGWEQGSSAFGLELQQPWAGAVVDGRKNIETRAYDLPPALLGKRIYIIQSVGGKDGVSSMGNVVDLLKSDVKVIGWCQFSAVKVYTNRHEFEQDEGDHLVSKDSGYGWKDGKTKVIYGWKVEKYERCGETDDGQAVADARFHTAVRRLRSLFQLKSISNSQPSGKNRSQNQKNGGSQTKKKNKKRRKRY